RHGTGRGARDRARLRARCGLRAGRRGVPARLQHQGSRERHRWPRARARAGPPDLPAPGRHDHPAQRRRRRVHRPPPARPGPGARSMSMRVLVVDDDFMVARVHSGYVARIPGCEVVGVAHSGADAVRLARELRPDLVLLDVYLPDRSGIEVLRELRTGSADDPFVLVITAADDPRTVTAALHGGATHYLVKPFDAAALREHVERVMRVRGRLAGLQR